MKAEARVHGELRAGVMSTERAKPWLLPVSLVTLYAIVASIALGSVAKVLIGRTPWGALLPFLLMLPIVAILALRRDSAQWIPAALLSGTVAAYVGSWSSFRLSGEWAVASWYFGAPLNIVLVLVAYGAASRQLRRLRGEPSS
jgi:hypothetical protein